MNNEITESASKVKRRKKINKFVRLAILFLILFLLITYVVMGLVYNGGNFSITLDNNLYLENNIIIYDDENYKVFRSELLAETMETFDNITGDWLPDDITEYEGSHNGDNYVAYSFYIENLGEDNANYWSQVILDDAINNVDSAMRVRVYKNGEPTTYVKPSMTGNPEPDTVPFESETLIALDEVKNFGPGDKNKYTVVIWLEGRDPECTDNIIGGEVKIHMEFNSEFVETD